MRIVFDGALTCTGGAQKRAGGAVSAKYSKCPKKFSDKRCFLMDCIQ